jgi:hypothetical protein
VALDGGAIGRIPFNVADGASTLPNSNVFATTQGGTLGAGVAVDLDIWGINQSGNSATHFTVDAAGNVTLPTAADQVQLDDKPAAPNNFCANPTSGLCKPRPYTYSDFTGFGLRNFTNPRGAYSWIEPGCGPDKTRWLRVEWDADTPQGTAVSVRARSANDTLGFGAAMWTGSYPTSPADLSQAPGPLLPNPSGYIQVEFNLTTTANGVTPALKSFRIVYDCVGQIG